MFSIFSRLIVLYNEFGVPFPFYTYLILFGVPVFGALQIFLSINKNISEKLIKIVIVVSIIAIPLYFFLGSFSFVSNLYNLSQ